MPKTMAQARPPAIVQNAPKRFIAGSQLRPALVTAVIGGNRWRWIAGGNSRLLEVDDDRSDEEGTVDEPRYPGLKEMVSA